MPASTTQGIKDLQFYGNDGNPLNLTLVNGVWTGVIYLPEVSVGLIENQTIYVIQKMLLSGVTVYGLPHVPLNNNSDSHSWQAVMNSVQSDKINLFTIDNVNENNPIISFVDANGMYVDGVANTADTIDPVTGLVAISRNVNQAIVLNVCLSSNDENAYQNTITISDASGIIAQISVYGETVGEDERFNVLLSNFGEQLLASDEFIFRTSDISEQLPDYKLLNRKRKELFIEYDNIIPYLSAYKGIINILKFFDYYDIQLKEYWFNPLTNKKTTRDIQINDYAALSTPPEIPKYPYQKTCNFGLFYEINQPTGEYDANGLPIMEWSDNYSQEEVLIKLFGLRNYIYRRNIGGISQITDIVGQVLYYAGSGLRSWNSQVEMITINRNICPSFSVDNCTGYIQDIRNIISVYSCSIPRNVTSLIGDYPLWEFSGCWVSYFDNKDAASPDFIADRSEGAPVGFPITLTNTSFDIPWNQCNTHWADTANISLPVSWANIGAQEYYDAEWIIKYTPDVSVDPRSFTADVRGSIADMASQQFMLPYSGKYDVTLILYGFNGIFSKHTEQAFINVQLKQPDFAVYYKIYDTRLQMFGTNSLTWAQISDDWNDTIYDTKDFPVSSSPLMHRSLSPVPYIPLIDDYADNKMIGYRELNWADITNPWTDIQFCTWREMSPIYGKHARFTINTFVPGEFIQVGRSYISIPSNTNLSDFVTVAGLLTASTLPDINTFTYTPRPFDRPTYIDCVSVNGGINGNMLVGSSTSTISINSADLYQTWNEVNFTWNEMPLLWSTASNIYEAKGYNEPFTNNNIRYYTGSFYVPVYVPVTFTYDNCGIPGKNNTRWILSLTDTGEVVADITSPRMMFRFAEIGNYNVTCTITDTNNNSATISRTSCVSVLPPDQWQRKYQY